MVFITYHVIKVKTWHVVCVVLHCAADVMTYAQQVTAVGSWGVATIVLWLNTEQPSQV